MNKEPAEEFIFIRDKLERIAHLVAHGNENTLREAIFMIGCLHNVCHENSILFQKGKCKTALHDR